MRRLSPATVSARYLGGINLTGFAEEREVTRLLSVEPAVHTVIVAVIDDQIRGIAEYVVHAPGCADVGMVVEDAFQGRATTG